MITSANDCYSLCIIDILIFQKMRVWNPCRMFSFLRLLSFVLFDLLGCLFLLGFFFFFLLITKGSFQKDKYILKSKIRPICEISWVVFFVSCFPL